MNSTFQLSGLTVVFSLYCDQYFCVRRSWWLSSRKFPPGPALSRLNDSIFILNVFLNSIYFLNLWPALDLHKNSYFEIFSLFKVNYSQSLWWHFSYNQTYLNLLLPTYITETLGCLAIKLTIFSSLIHSILNKLYNFSFSKCKCMSYYEWSFYLLGSGVYLFSQNLWLCSLLHTMVSKFSLFLSIFIFFPSTFYCC